MAREQVEQGILRGCPTCGTKVSDVEMGLRDYRWVNDALPGKVGGMDVDFVLNQSRTDRTLIFEFKPKNAYISMGHRLTFRDMVRRGVDVWIAWDQGDGTVKVGAVDRHGKTPFIEHMPIAKLRTQVRSWWNEGLDDE